MIGTLILGAAMAAAAGHAPESVPPFAYHLRVVRVSPAAAVPGAAIGWAPNGGAPVVFPSEEAWGTPEQLSALTSLLGGDQTQAVTGFFAVAESDGELRFERKVYLGDAVLDLAFRASPPGPGKGAHRVSLTLSRPGNAEPPLAEADVLLTTDRTVALAVPGAVAGDWIVLGVTPLEPLEAAEKIRGATSIARLEDGGITMPELQHRVMPIYPRGAKQERTTGRIVLQVLLDREGVPRAPAIVKMDPGTEELACAAVEAVQQWRYKPATSGGAPVPVWFHIVVSFELR